MCKRIGLAVAIVVAMVGSLRAQDEPQGAIGVQLKLEEGKVIITGTIEKSPAAKAGIKSDDVLVQVGEYKLKEATEEADLHDLVKEIGKFKPGQKVKVTVKRGEKNMEIVVTVGKRADVIDKDKD